MPRNFNVERELSLAIEGIGGVRVDSILGRLPGHESADFAFLSESVVAELKCLEVDQIVAPHVMDKASKLYLEELSAGRSPVIVYGQRRLTTEGFSDGFKQKIHNLYRAPIERVAAKANSQILATTRALRIQRPIGLWMLANNNHSALDPQHLWFIVNEILRSPSLYPSISAAVIFSGNLPATAPGVNGPMDYWIEIQRAGMLQPSARLRRSLRRAWNTRLAGLFGMRPMEIGLADHGVLARLESKRI